MTIEYVLVSIDWNNSGLIVKKSYNPSRNRDWLSIYKSDNRGCEYEVSFDGLTNLIYIDTNTCTETYPSQMDKLNWTMIIIIILRQQRTKAVSNKKYHFLHPVYSSSRLHTFIYLTSWACKYKRWRTFVPIFTCFLTPLDVILAFQVTFSAEKT